MLCYHLQSLIGAPTLHNDVREDGNIQ